MVSFQGISLAFFTTFLRGNDEKCSVYRPVMANVLPRCTNILLRRWEKIGCFGFSSATWLHFVWGTTVMSFPEPVKVSRYLVPVGCVCPSGGSYLSSSCRMCSWPCFAGGPYEELCHSPAKEWGLAACLLCVVTTSDDELLRLTPLQEPLQVYSGSALCCR